MAREGRAALVACPLGLVRVRLNRWGLELSDRGGFEAAWAGEGAEGSAAGEELTLEAYRLLAKAHLREVYRGDHGREPPAIPLNLASHALADDLIGWTKLNHRSAGT